MADLTQQDRKNYSNLKEAVKALSDKIDAQNLLKPSLHPLIAALLTKLPESLKTPADLEDLLAKVDSYLIMQNLLLELVKNADPQKEVISEPSQRLDSLSKQLKASLQDVEDADLSTLDDLDPPCRDEQFFRLLKDNGNVKANTWTQKLLDGYPPKLEGTQVDQLTDAWGAAISDIVKDARTPAGALEPGDPKAIFRFFCIHQELEALYDKLSNLPNIVA